MKSGPSKQLQLGAKTQNRFPLLLELLSWDINAAAAPLQAKRSSVSAEMVQKR